MATSWMERTKIVMQSRGISQEELAASVSCTRGAIGHYLNGRRSPSLAQLNRIAAALRTDPAWLLFGNKAGGVREGGSDYHSSGIAVPLAAVVRDGRRRRGGNPVSLPAAGDCYAVSIAGDDYEPRIHAGEAVLVDPRRRPAAGDEILVSFKDRSIRLHSLVRLNQDGVTVDSIVGEKQVRTLPQRNYRAIHKIVAIFRPG